MPQSNHTASVKDFGWKLQSLITNFLQQDRASIAQRMRDDGLRTSQIARVIYGKVNKTTMNKVGLLLKEVK